MDEMVSRIAGEADSLLPVEQGELPPGALCSILPSLVAQMTGCSSLQHAQAMHLVSKPA